MVPIVYPRHRDLPYAAMKYNGSIQKLYGTKPMQKQRTYNHHILAACLIRNVSSASCSCNVDQETRNTGKDGT